MHVIDSVDTRIYGGEEFMRTDIHVAYRRPTGNTSSQKAAVVTQWRRSQPRAAFVRGRARVVVVCVRACVQVGMPVCALSGGGERVRPDSGSNFRE